MYTVYVLRWPRSSLIYVGRTSNPAARLASHKVKWKPLGLGKPYMEVLEENLTEEAAYVAEQTWIAFLNSTVPGVGLNRTYGGAFGMEIRVDRHSCLICGDDMPDKSAKPSRRPKSKAYVKQ